MLKASEIAGSGMGGVPRPRANTGGGGNPPKFPSKKEISYQCSLKIIWEMQPVDCLFLNPHNNLNLNYMRWKLQKSVLHFSTRGGGLGIGSKRFWSWRPIGFGVKHDNSRHICYIYFFKSATPPPLKSLRGSVPLAPPPYAICMHICRLKGWVVWGV